MGIVDRIEKDLFVRYNMDPVKWREAQRRGFPYNVPLELILGVPLVVPLFFILSSLFLNMKSTFYLKTIIQTIVSSLFGYFISDLLIDSFKDTLCAKGLFGRDLNKAGI
jgi:hypothetical protein